MENKVELTNEELNKIAGGNDGLTTRKVCGLAKGYLALRNDTCYDDKNIIGHLYNNDLVYSTEQYRDGYVWVYAECRKDTVYPKEAFSGYGWVNAGFLA